MKGRPLTQISSDFRDVEPITPNHFLVGRPLSTFTTGIFSDKSVTIASSWKQAQQLCDQFWNCFLKEYMLTLLKLANGPLQLQICSLATWFGLKTILHHVCYGQWQVSTKCFRGWMQSTQNDPWLHSQTSQKVNEKPCRLRRQKLKLRPVFICVNRST